MAELGKLEAAEARLKGWQSRQANAAKELDGARTTASEAIQAEGKRLNGELEKARQLEKELMERRGELRVDAEIENSLSSAANQGSIPHDYQPGVLRRGLTITGEIIFGVEEQSPEEIGTISREAQEHIKLTEARLRQIRKAIEVEQARAKSLKAQLDGCVAHQNELAAAAARPGPVATR